MVQVENNADGGVRCSTYSTCLFVKNNNYIYITIQKGEKEDKSIDQSFFGHFYGGLTTERLTETTTGFL